MSRVRHRLYRDVANGRIAGVCSGISDHYGFSVCAVRLICIFACVFFGWFAIPAYVLMALTLPVKPGQEGTTVPSWRNRMHKRRKHRAGHDTEAETDEDGDDEEASEDTEWKRFEQGVNRAPRDIFQSVRHSFRELEDRLQRMERYVTSRHYDLDKEFRDLGA
jgi:phage shock protein C